LLLIPGVVMNLYGTALFVLSGQRCRWRRRCRWHCLACLCVLLA